jgi:hypothetical protein
MHRHTGQMSVSECRSGIQRHCQKAQPFAFILKKQRTKRFAFWHLRWIPPRRSLRSLGRNDAESLGSGRNEQPCVFGIKILTKISIIATLINNHPIDCDVHHD